MARWTPDRRKKAWIKTGFSAYYGLFLVFIYGPMIAMFILSFQGERGGTSFPMRGVSLHWWKKLIEPSTVGDLQGAMGRSLILALIVMVITALFATMLAMAFRKPFRGSGVRRGLLNTALVDLGILDKPASFLLYSEFGYVMALVQLYVVLCVGPMFFSLAKIDKAILEAARDMGATPFQIFREIIGPLSLPGVAIGMIFIFVILMGEFATAVVVYGGKTSTTGTVILNYYAIANYPFAAVNALMLMLAMMIGVVIILRLVNIRREL